MGRLLCGFGPESVPESQPGGGNDEGDLPESGPGRFRSSDPGGHSGCFCAVSHAFGRNARAHAGRDAYPDAFARSLAGCAGAAVPNSRPRPAARRPDRGGDSRPDANDFPDGADYRRTATGEGPEPGDNHQVAPGLLARTCPCPGCAKNEHHGRHRHRGFQESGDTHRHPANPSDQGATRAGARRALAASAGRHDLPDPIRAIGQSKPRRRIRFRQQQRGSQCHHPGQPEHLVGMEKSGGLFRGTIGQRQRLLLAAPDDR